jgi:hypothetical protein
MLKAYARGWCLPSTLAVAASGAPWDEAPAASVVVDD